MSDSLCPPTCTGDIVLLQNLVVSAGTHSASWDGKAEGTASPIIHTACIVTWRNRSQIRCLAHLKIHFLNTFFRVVGFLLLFCLFSIAQWTAEVQRSLAKKLCKNKLFHWYETHPLSWRDMPAVCHVIYNHMSGGLLVTVWVRDIWHFYPSWGNNLSFWTKPAFSKGKKKVSHTELRHKTPLSLSFNTEPKGSAWTNEIKLLVL